MYYKFSCFSFFVGVSVQLLQRHNLHKAVYARHFLLLDTYTRYTA
jgi:hypothetical protein